MKVLELSSPEQLLLTLGEEFLVNVGWRNKSNIAYTFIVEVAIGNFDEPSGAGSAFWQWSSTVSLDVGGQTSTEFRVWANVGVWDIRGRIANPETGQTITSKVLKEAIKVAPSVAAMIIIGEITNIGP